MVEDESLKLDYISFETVLKEWDKYTLVTLKKLAQKMHTTFQLHSGHSFDLPYAEQVNLSELSRVLWNSLREGPGNTDFVHDDFYVNEQIDYFKSRFNSAEEVKRWMTSTRYGEACDIDDPLTSFTKLGKSAQLEIVREGFLETAFLNYERAKKLVREDEYHAEIKREEERVLNRIVLRVKKEVREIDNNQCVYCGRKYNYHSFNYLKDKSDLFESGNVLLSCNGCSGKRKKQIVEPKFGRFKQDEKI